MNIVEELIDLANECKDFGYYEVSNLIFKGIIKFFFDNSEIKYEVETRDGIESEPQRNLGEAYYDLAVLRYRGKYLCIPVPLLTGQEVCALMKVAKIVPFSEHKRELKNANSKVMAMADLLWKIGQFSWLVIQLAKKGMIKLEKEVK